jgi:hypothetical protein
MRITLEKQEQKEQAIKSMVINFFKKNKCKRATLEIRKYKSERHNYQNKLYWVWLAYIEKETGSSVKDFKDNGFWRWGLNTTFKCNFIEQEYYKEPNGDIVRITPSLKELSVSQFREFLERIEEGMEEAGVTLPRPVNIYDKAMYGD